MKKSGEKNERWQVQLKLNVHSRSEIDTIRLPSSVRSDSSFSCNSSTVVQTGLNGNCNYFPNRQHSYVTLQSTPVLALEQSTLHYWDRETGTGPRLEREENIGKSEKMSMFKNS